MKAVFVVFPLLCSLLSGSATAGYIRSTAQATCPSEPCLLLEEYVSSVAQYFISDTSFVLLEGEHYLNTPLVLSDITSMTLSGNGSGAVIILSAEAFISYTNSYTISLSSLEVVYAGKTVRPKSALLFENSHSVQIANVNFTGQITEGGHSQALSYSRSTGDVINCSFSSGHSEYGGAMNVNSSNITLSGVSYTDNNADASGGAIFADNSRLVFGGTNSFLRNKASAVHFVGNYTVGGGAIFATQTFIELEGFNSFVESGPIDPYQHVVLGGAIMLRQASNLRVQGVALFSKNRGNSGAAVFSINSNLSLTGNVSFANNRAPFAMGGAIFALNSVVHCEGNVRFSNNYAITGGAMYIEKSVLNCQGNITFASNSATSRGGGMYAVDSTVAVSGRSNYTENTAEEGGGMGLEGTTRLVLQSPVTINFYQNSASLGGGIFFLDSTAMYIAQCQKSTVERLSCFFQLLESVDMASRDIHLNFVENNASSAGSVLYGGALQLCQVQASDQTYVAGFPALTNISTTFIGNSYSYISSNPLKVCFCDNGEVDCNPESKTISVKRGELFNVSVTTVGQFDMPVPSTIKYTYSTDNDDSSTELITSTPINSGACFDVTVQLKTKDRFGRISLFPQGPCRLPDLVRHVYVHLDPCPPGFQPILNHCKCEGRLLEFNSTTVCDIDTGLIQRPGASWIQPMFDENDTYQGFVLQRNCPVNYCKLPQESVVLLDFSSSATTDDQCTPNRTGRMCGACIDGYSKTLSKFRCKVCGNEYLGLMLVFGFAGVALIALLLILHLTVAAGTINGLILYVNVINICRNLFFPPDETGVNPLTLFVSWLNLDFGIATCLYDGLSSYAYTWLQFVFPLYLWFLIGAIIAANKVSAKVGKLFGSNPVAVLATVILMSYTKLLQTTVDVLSYTYLEFPDGTKNKFWLIDPNIPFMEGKHIWLVLISFFVIIFLLFPYIFVLVFGYFLQAHSGKRGFFWFNKFKPFLDAYYAPYRKQMRCWTGLLLLIRGLLFLTFILTTINANLVAASAIFIALAMVPWLSNSIYEKRYANLLEASFFLNLCVLLVVTLFTRSSVPQGNQIVVTYVSVGIAFVEFWGIVAFHVYLRLRKMEYIRNHKFVKYVNERLKKEKLAEGKLFKLKKTKKPELDVMVPVTSTTVSFVSIREPLLEDD